MKPADLLRRRVLFFHGEETGLSLEAAMAVVEAAGLVKDDFDLEIRNGDEGLPADWLASVSTSPFLADRRTIVVRHALRIDTEKLSAVSMRALPASSLLILVADDEGATTRDRQTRFAAQEKALLKLVKEADGEAVEHKNDPNRAKGRIKLDLAVMNLKITERALDQLMEMCGSRYGRARGELDKLALFSEGGTIRENDVAAVVVPSRDFQIFNLVNAIVDNRAVDALKQLRTILASAKKVEDEAFISIFPMISRTLRLVWQARLCHDAGCTPTSPTPEVLEQLLDKPQLRSENPYRLSALMRTARAVPLGRIARCLAIVADADSRMKGALSGYTAMETLERMVLEMIEAIHAPTRKAG